MKTTKIYALVMVFCLLTLMPANVLAGDYAKFRFFGFSKDGKYLAFEEYGTGDGSGYPYAYIYFVDTQKNAFVGKPFKVELESETAEEKTALKKAAAMAAGKMRGLKIVEGNTGKLVAAHLITDLTFDESLTRWDGKPEKIKFKDEVESSWSLQNGFYELNLNSIPTTTKNCQDEDYKFYKFELALDQYRQYEPENQSQILQKDAELPLNRACALGYKIDSVYFYNDRIAVFLNVFSRGWEGPDMRYLVVTGKLSS